MKILIMPSWYPTKEKPLSGIFFKEQAQALARRGHDVAIAVMRSDGGKTVSCDVTREGNFREYIFHHAPMRFHLTYFRVVHYLCRFVRAEFPEGKPDVIHVHSAGYLKYARALRFLFGIPIVVTEHATMYERRLWSEKRLRRISRDLSASDAVIAVGPGLKKCIQPLCPKKDVLVIPNMVSEAFFERRRETIPAKPFRFVSVAILNRKKGLDILLRSFAKLMETHPDTTLTICGGGADAEELLTLAGQLNLADKVTFTGAVTREECARQLCRSHAFILPSRFETFGIVYIEAMACGLPVIMTKTSAWELLVRPETGLAVEIEDVDGLAAAMASMMENYGSYDPDTIVGYCRNRFSENAVCAELEKVYEKVRRKHA